LQGQFYNKARYGIVRFNVPLDTLLIMTLQR